MAGTRDKTTPTTGHADMLLAVKQEADAVVAEARALEREASAMQGLAAAQGEPGLGDLLLALRVVADMGAFLLARDSITPEQSETVTEIAKAATGFVATLEAASTPKPG